MKLLYITNGINGAGGLERVLSIKASYLAEHYDYNITILSLNEDSIEPFYQFSEKIKFKSIRVYGNPFQYLMKYRNGMKNIIEQFNPDIISVCDDGLKGFFLPLLLSTKIPMVYERHVSKEIELHGKESFIKQNLIKAKWSLMESLGHSFNKFIVLTEGNKEEWPNLKNLQVIANPLSFYPNQSSSLDTKKVICVGKISYQKGQDLLVKAWDLLWDKHPDWKLELYGYANDDFLNASRLAKNNIHYFPPEKNIMQKYLDSSIYVMSSRYEGFGMVLIEAMACGVPCVSFDCNHGPSDIIKNDLDGFLVKNGNIDELVEKLSILIENQNLRIGMGKKAKENVKRFLPENIVKEWDNLFKSLVQ